jgi:hypothetical protein
VLPEANTLTLAATALTTTTCLPFSTAVIVHANTADVLKEWEKSGYQRTEAFKA